MPPTDSLYFPTALAISPGRTSLYVVNSDFDLQYNGGTIQVLNLGSADGGSGTNPVPDAGLRVYAETVANAIAAGEAPTSVCASIGLVPNVNDTLYPGPCSALEVAPFVRAHATIGAFGSGMSLIPRVGEPGLRLFTSVRGDPSVTYFDVADDRDPANIVTPCESNFCLECGGGGDEKRCSASHKVGENVFTSQRGLLLPTEPVGIASATSVLGDAIVVAHQTSASASLVVNQWGGDAEADVPFEDTPSLEFILTELPEAPTGVLAIPPPRLVASQKLDYSPGFVVSHRAASTLSVVRFEADQNSTPPRPFIVQSDSVSISLSNDGSDSRGLAFDSTARVACETECEQSLCPNGSCEANQLFTNCLVDCLEEPIGFYVVNRTPASLLVGRMETSPVLEDERVVGINESFVLAESIPLPLGAATIGVGSIIGLDGELETRVFVASFDSRFVSVYDPLLRRIESSFRTGRGPTGLVFDTDPVAKTSHLYVADFTDSYLSVIDLDSRRLTYGTALLNIGPPVPPREEQ